MNLKRTLTRKLLTSGPSLLCAVALAQTPATPPPTSSLVNVTDHRIAGPAKPADFPDWIEAMKQWRSEQLARLHYSGAEYDRPELKWTQSSFMQPQMMVEDRYFYDPVAGKYTVDRYLDDLAARYGGIDSVLIWPSYPNIGIDNRNQFDVVSDMPGGMEGVRRMVADFHRRGVRVLFPYMPWEHGTRDPGKPNAQALSEELAAIGADGINGDTMSSLPMEFRTASDKTGHPLAFEAEVFGDDSALAFNNLGWEYAVPIRSNFNIQDLNVGYLGPEFVEKYKWLEPRHMTNIDDRWQRNKIPDLQFAFFNGIGMETWENVWGIWNGMTPRDAEATRRIGLIERRYATLLNSGEWEPHTPTLQRNLYASRWPGKDATLYTLINRNEFDVTGEQLRLSYKPGAKFYDLWQGLELSPRIEAGTATLRFPMEGYGFGAILVTEPGSNDLTLASFLAHTHERNTARLDSFSPKATILKQTLVDIPATKLAATAPNGMVPIPAADYEFRVVGIEIEGGNLEGVDVQYPWEQTPMRNHLHRMTIAAFYIDRFPVTNADFKRFLDTSRYHPRDDHNFLRDWKNGTYPEGWANKPVTWVSVEDARAYAQWAGKRLPHEWEWQYAAQGSDGRTYPWGNAWDAALVPATDTGRTMAVPPDAGLHPAAASPFGVQDLTATVWQWTDEYRDEHTRAAILRGGSTYRPRGAIWYFPQAYPLEQHGKLLLLSPGRDRNASTGFRCVVDAQPSNLPL